MEAIPVPVINHILCVSMKFHFLCDIMRGESVWAGLYGVMDRSVTCHLISLDVSDWLEEDQLK